MHAHEIDTSKVYLTVNGQHAGHRSPAQAGSSDRYYGRPCRPNFAYHGRTFCEEEMTEAQCREYEAAWYAETDRKDWGSCKCGGDDE